MGKFDGYLICTDLDGTFAFGTEICGENAEYVKYFQENGGLFTVSTGRLTEYINEFKDFKPNAPVITFNGAVIYDMEEEKILCMQALPETVGEIIEFVVGKNYKNLNNIWLNGLGSTIEVSENKDVDFGDEYFKLVLTTDNAEFASFLNKELKAKFGDRLDIFLGWSLGVECLAKNTNKGWAVTKLKEILGDKVKKVICVGDSESDAFMLRCADIGYAVENASKEAKEAADRITIHYKDGAIAQIIKDLEKELHVRV